MFTESVVVFHRDDNVVNEIGETVTKWTPEKVSGVVVRPQTPEDEKNALMPDGIRIRFRLAFPKTYAQSLEHCRIALPSRGMSETDADAAYIVVGAPQHTRPCPTLWDMICEVGKHDG